jgi:hypothetical protein
MGIEILYADYGDAGYYFDSSPNNNMYWSFDDEGGPFEPAVSQ